MRRTVSRRSFLSQVAGAGSLALVPLSAARAQPPTQQMEVDQDPSDPARPLPASTPANPSTSTAPGTASPERRPTGFSDSDSGSSPDPANYGRRGRTRGRRGLTDSDPTDPVGRGRPTGPATDSDAGANADAAGRGPRSRFITCPGHRRCPR